VIQKIPQKTNQPFDLVTYLLRPDKGYVIGNTFVANPLTPQTVVAELNTYSALNPKVEHLVSHMSLRLAPGEHLSDAQFRAIAAEYLRGLGYGDCPYLVARHTDASSEHIHIVVSRIARDGHCVSNSFDWPKGESLVRQFEIQYGLRQVPSSDQSLWRSLTRGELAHALRNQEPSARQALQEIVSQAAREAQDFPGFVARLEEEDVALIVHLDREGRLHGYSYELEGYALAGSQLGRGFTLGGIERGYGICPDSEAHADLVARLTRAPEPGVDSPPEISETSGDSLEPLRIAVRETLTQASSFEDYAERLEASGIHLEVLPDSQGRPHGLVYATSDLRATASFLGKDFTLGALKRRGLTPSENGASPDDAPDVIPALSRSRDDAAIELVRIVDRVAVTSADFRTFREELLRSGVRLAVHYTEMGKPTGLTYHWNEYRWAGKELGTSYTLGGLKKTRGLTPEPDAASLQAAQEALATILRRHAVEAATFRDFQLACEDEGITLRLYLRSQTAVGIGYTYKDQYFKARSLDNDLTLIGLLETFHLAPDLGVPEVRKIAVELKAGADDQEAMESVRLRIDQAAAEARDFDDFSSRLLSAGVEVKLRYNEAGKPTGITYHSDDHVFSGKALGDDYTVPGLRRNKGISPDPDPERLAATTESLVSVLRHVTSEAQSFERFQAALEAESVKIRLFTRDDKVLGIGYTYKDAFFASAALPPEFSLAGLRETFGLSPDLSQPALQALAVPLPKSPSPKDAAAIEAVRELVDQAASSAMDFEDLRERLHMTGVEIAVRYTEAGKPTGLTYRLERYVFTGKTLGDEYSIAGLRGRGLEPAHDRERLEAATLTVTEALRRITPSAQDFRQFQAELAAESISVRLFVKQDSPSPGSQASQQKPGLTVVGIGYSYKDGYVPLDGLPAELSLSGLRDTFHLTPDLEDPEVQKACVTLPDTLSPERAAALQAVRTKVARCLENCPDFATFQANLETQGMAVKVRHNAAGGVKGLVYEADGKRYSGSALGEAFTPKGLRGAGAPAPSDPVLREASRQELTALAHRAARCGSPPTFTQFGEALEAEGVNLRLYTKEGEPVGVAYRYKEEAFAARALGPEMTLRGLRTHFEITIAETDRAYVESISTESTRDTPPPDETEIRETLTPVILAIAADCEDASEFLTLLEEQGIGLRLYLSAEGEPRRLAYEYDQTFYTPKQLGGEVDLPNLIRNHGLRFDPEDDAPVFARCGVPLAKNATVTRTDFVPYVAEAVAVAAADSPDLPLFVERLNRAKIELHLLTPADDPSRIVGITYEHKDIFVSARSLGSEYTFTGLQSHFGVTIDPGRDADLVRDLSRALPDTRPADPRDVWEEVRDRLTLVATEARDFGTYVARLEESGIHPILRVDDADRLVGITYRVAGRELRDQQLGPDFTPAGLRQAYDLAPQPSDRERLGAHIVREEDWTRILASRLEIASGQAALVRRHAAQSLRHDPLQALRTVANAQYLLSAAINPRLAARAAMLKLPGGRLLNDALSFAAAFRSPVAATVFGLRMASRGFAAAARTRQPQIPTFDAVARRVLEPFLAAAKEGAPSAAVFAHRLRLAGIEPQVVIETQRPALYYQLADHFIPATDLGDRYTLAALARHYGGEHGGDHATIAAALDPHWRAGVPDIPRPHAAEQRPDSRPDRPTVDSPAQAGGSPALHGRRDQGADGASALAPPPEHDAHLATPGESALAPTGAPHLGAGPSGPVDPDVSAPELAPAAAESLPGPAIATSGIDPAPERPPVDLQAVRHHLDSLGSDRFDLRIDTPGALPAFHRGLTREEVIFSIPGIWQEASLGARGATVGVRPTSDPAVQLLRDLTSEHIAEASRRGFQPALTVETAPGRFEVWVRHLAFGAEGPPPEVLNYARRAVRLEYGLPSARRDGAYGRLAGIPGEHFTPRLAQTTGMTYSRAGEYVQILGSHWREAQAALHASLSRFRLPTPGEFHRQNPTLSRRESDLLWAERAHLSRLPAHQILSALAAGRQKAHEPQSALRYASNLYSVMLRDATRISPAAAQAATLRALSTATGAPVLLLRLALGVARPILRVFRP
jgi:hypothetical protein